MLDLNKPVQTASGKPVRIICSDKKGYYNIVGLISLSDNSEEIFAWSDNGVQGFKYTHGYNLVNVPVRSYKFMNVYSPDSQTAGVLLWDSQKEADDIAFRIKNQKRVGILKYTLDDDKVVDVTFINLMNP